jgi:hypothetical protein
MVGAIAAACGGMAVNGTATWFTNGTLGPAPGVLFRRHDMARYRPDKVAGDSSVGQQEIGTGN